MQGWEVPLGHHHCPAISCSTFLKVQHSHSSFSSGATRERLTRDRPLGSAVCWRGAKETRFCSPLHISLAVRAWARCFTSRRCGFQGCPTCGPRAGRLQLRVAVNAAQHKVVNLLKTLRNFSVITCCNIFNVWPKTTLLPVWPRDTKRLDTPGGKQETRWDLVGAWCGGGLSLSQGRHLEAQCWGWGTVGQVVRSRLQTCSEAMASGLTIHPR